MVTFHIFKGVLGVDAICNAQGALVTLPLIGAKLLRFSKRTKGQVLFIAPSAVRENERDDACLLGHIIVHHEFFDVSFKRMLMQTLYVGLIGHYSKNDELYITGYISSVKELREAVPALRGGIDAAYDASLPEGIDIMKFPVFYTASNVQEAYKRVQQKIVSKIDDYFASEVKVRVSGIGFYTDTLSDEKFVEFMRLHKAALTAPSAPIELRDIYENVVERHGHPEDFLVEDSDFDCKASVIAYAMNNETVLCAGQDIFDGMLGSKETDAENCSCVSVSDKEFARLHSKFGLKREDVLEAIKAYAQELGLEYGPVNYFMMCDPKYANDLGEVVQ